MNSRKEAFPEQHAVILAVIVVFGEWGSGRKCGWLGDLCLSSGGQEVTQVHRREGWGAMGGPLPAGSGGWGPWFTATATARKGAAPGLVQRICSFT